MTDVPKPLEHVCFFVPVVSEIPTTGRYNHAHELPAHADTAELITWSEPPDAVADRYDSVHVLDRDGLVESVQLARRAASIADGSLSPRRPSELFVTSFHFAPVLAGYLSDAFWTVSVHDEVRQSILNNPLSDAQLRARISDRLIDRADRRVYLILPEGGAKTDMETRYVFNGLGCPVDQIDAGYGNGDPLNAIWVGKTGLDEGQETLVDAVSRLPDRTSVEFDVYGAPYDEAQRLARERDVDNTITYHGRRPHEEIRSAITDADIGLCTLPCRPDWMQTAPVKAREYMAGAAIPVFSDFAGLRQLGRNCAVYARPTGRDLAEALAWLGDRSDEQLREIKRDVRDRAESMPMSEGREWWARQITGRVGADHRDDG